MKIQYEMTSVYYAVQIIPSSMAAARTYKARDKDDFVAQEILRDTSIVVMALASRRYIQRFVRPIRRDGL